MTDDNDMTPRTEAGIPERIIATAGSSYENGTYSTYIERSGSVEYVRADVALAMVAAALRRAAGIAKSFTESEEDHHGYIARCILDLTDADALAALEAVKQEARREERESLRPLVDAGNLLRSVSAGMVSVRAAVDAWDNAAGDRAAAIRSQEGGEWLTS